MMEELSPQLRHQLAQFQQVQQQAQALATQKQQLELTVLETKRALEELEKLRADAVVYKSVGSILVKADLEELKRELGEQKETLELRVKTIGRQEERVSERLREMRERLQEVLKGRPPKSAGGGRAST